MSSNRKNPICLFLAIVSILSFFYVYTSFNLSFQPSTRRESDVNDDPLPSKVHLGIGFDLTPSYGTVAISLPNGSTCSIAKVSGSTAYHDTLARLALPSSQHLAPPYSSMQDQLSDLPRQQLRRARKSAGLSASDDVGALAEMITALRAEAEKYLNASITSAVATTPHLVALYDEDIADAFEHAALSSPEVWLFKHLVYSTSAAYAGNGLGLCENYATDPKGCYEEWNSRPSEVVMTVLYTQTALSVTLSSVKSAYYLWEPTYRYIIDFDLGSAATPDAETDREGWEEYWRKVQGKLVSIMEQFPRYAKPARVLLMGESAADDTFRRFLDSALKGVMEKSPRWEVGDEMFVGAKGAAEFAKRAPFEGPWHAGWNGSVAEEWARRFEAEDVGLRGPGMSGELK
ncbi:hypothetical protein LTS18_003160 [Coniosporium uncinatum]|uniref:Uncharacterized protein n=1 Tax=Coniosporium uncinatum TaxID=93489 RepID=A0ACC3DCJ5_9PEZI|nr:hypothetical protein LTS18_003160 [Coniosporium uncinatum]